MPQSDVLKSYQGPPTAGKPGEVEAWALMQAAVRLKEAAETSDVETIMVAVRLNWRMWTIFQAELLDPECTVPMDVRSNILSLANFIDKHTVAYIADSKPEKLEILISINRDLSAGLYAAPPPDQAEAAEAATGNAAEPRTEAPAEPGEQPQSPSSVKISI